MPGEFIDDFTLENISDACNLGNSYLKLKEYAKATEVFQKLVNDFPGNIIAMLGLARSNLNRGYNKECITIIQEALLVYPDDTRLLLLNMEAFYNLRQYDRALGVCARLKDLYSNDDKHPPFRFYYLRGLAQSSLTLHKEARGSYTFLKQKYPDSPTGYIMTALEYQKEDKLKESYLELKRLLELFPGQERSIHPLNMLGKEYLKSKNIDRAGEIFQIILDEFPKSIIGELGLATIKFESKSYEDCLRITQKALLKDPKDTRLLLLLMKCYYPLGQHEHALKVCNQLLLHYDSVNQPCPFSVYYIRGLSCSFLNYIDQSIKAYTLLKQNYPDSPTGYIMLALEYQKEGLLEQSYQELNRLLELFPGEVRSIHPLNMLGKEYLKLKDIDKATEIFQRILEDFPKSIIGELGLATIKLENKYYKDCLRITQKGLSKDPEDVRLLLLLMKSYFPLGQHENALVVCKKLVLYYDSVNERCPFSVYYIQGLSYSFLNRYDKSRKAYLLLKEAYPDNPNGFLLMARQFQKERKYKEAQSEFEEAFQHFQESIEVLRSYNALLVHLGDFKSSKNIINKFIGNNGVSPDMLDLLMKSNIQLLKWKDAFKNWKNLSYNFPYYDTTYISNRLIDSITRANRFDALDEVLKELETRNEDNPHFNYLRALIWHQKFDKTLALNCILACEESLAPFLMNNINVTLLKAEIYNCHGDFGLGDKTFRSFLRSGPTKAPNAVVFLNWAASFFKRNEKESALSNIDKALYLDNSSPRILDLKYRITERYNSTESVLRFLSSNAHKSHSLLMIYIKELIIARKFKEIFELFDREDFSNVLTWKISLDLFYLFKEQSDWSNISRVFQICRRIGVVSATEFNYKLDLLMEAKGLQKILASYDLIEHSINDKEEIIAELNNQLESFMNVGATLMETTPFPFQEFLKRTLNNETPGFTFEINSFDDLVYLEKTYKRKFLNTYRDPVEAFEIAKMLKRRIQEKIPTSLIRLGDGEGMMVAYSDDLKPFEEPDRLFVQKVWWGKRLIQGLEYKEVIRLLESAIINADILGIPGWNRIIRDLAHLDTSLNKPQLRGMLGVFACVRKIVSDNPGLKDLQCLTSAHIWADLSYWDLFPYILKDVRSCILISGHLGLDEVVREKFNISEIDTMLIPGEHEHLDKNQISEYVDPYPDFFNDIMTKIKFDEGKVYLVAAGFLGKIYCGRIKEQGGIAIDIGALADYWIGKKTRNRFIQIHPIPGLKFPAWQQTEYTFNDSVSLLSGTNKNSIYKDKTIVFKLFVFKYENECSFSTDRKDEKFSGRSKWSYYTFIHVYKNPQPGTKRYYVYDRTEEHGAHIILCADDYRIRDESKGPLLEFYAYPVQHHLSHIQAFRLHFSSNYAQVNFILNEEELKYKTETAFYPAKDSLYNTGITISKNQAAKEISMIPDVSIVMSYYNRKRQLLFTLDSISSTKYPKNRFEIIIVDDASIKSQQLTDIIDDYNFSIKLIRLDQEYKQEKNYKNPCIPYNIGFGEAAGETIIIQNPEVSHMGDVISYSGSNLKKDQYLSFTCANLNRAGLNTKLNEIIKSREGPRLDNVRSFIQALSVQYRNSYNIWYNHVKFRPEALHFLSVLHSSQLNKLEGFGEAFAFGYAFDDNEFVYRIKNFLKLEVSFVNWEDCPFGIHQWHPKYSLLNSDFSTLYYRNKMLHRELSKNEHFDRIIYSHRDDASKLVLYVSPKAGITTIRSWFLVLLKEYSFSEAVSRNPHEFNWLAYENDAPSETVDYNQILVFRDPIDRFLSMYKSLFVIGYYDKHIFKRTSIKVDSMAHLIELLYEEMMSGNYVLLNDEHISPQTKLMPNIKYDQIFSTSRMNECLLYLNKKYKVDFKYNTATNVSNATSDHLIISEFELLEERHVEKLRAIYQEDLEFWEEHRHEIEQHIVL